MPFQTPLRSRDASTPRKNPYAPSVFHTDEAQCQLFAYVLSLFLALRECVFVEHFFSFFQPNSYLHSYFDCLEGTDAKRLGGAREKSADEFSREMGLLARSKDEIVVGLVADKLDAALERLLHQRSQNAAIESGESLGAHHVRHDAHVVVRGAHVLLRSSLERVQRIHDQHLGSSGNASGHHCHLERVSHQCVGP